MRDCIDIFDPSYPSWRQPRHSKVAARIPQQPSRRRDHRRRRAEQDNLRPTRFDFGTVATRPESALYG
jgi:hypothetical protein